MRRTWPVFLGLLLLAAQAAQAQFTHSINAGGATATITGYAGAGGVVIIPAATNGLVYFSEPLQPGAAGRFYRIGSQ